MNKSRFRVLHKSFGKEWDDSLLPDDGVFLVPVGSIIHNMLTSLYWHCPGQKQCRKLVMMALVAFLSTWNEILGG